MNKLDLFNKKQLKKDIPEIRSGYTIQVHQKIKEKDKQRIQIFEGLVIACKHGKGINATITVRKISQGVGVERIFPIHASFIEKIEVIKKHKVRRAKLYYIRDKSAKQSRLKEIIGKPTKKEPVLKKKEIEQKTEIKKVPM
ncbi:MAG: 50S ribosomal protein L19 [Parcubacteria group bacterium]|nr:50S ribosomal protein L19 [Parcubacteria group bacterium]